MTGDLLERMPQKGPMLLIERVVEIDADRIRCVARDHGGADYPLRVDGDLEPASLVELGAQAAAAHASAHGMGQRHAGLLLALHEVEILGDAGEGPLDIQAECMFFEEGAARYRFTVGSSRAPVLRGEATMKMRRVDP
ncbi:MAG: hypothetical protein ACK5MQ_14920 [Pikeienuella sp.]